MVIFTGLQDRPIYLQKTFSLTLESLKDNIFQEMAAVQVETLQKVMKMLKTNIFAIPSGDYHLQDIIFQTERKVHIKSKNNLKEIYFEFFHCYYK